MSGTVSYELLNSKFSSGNSGFTIEGGYYETFVNNTGLSVKGTIVVASTSVFNGVDVAPIDSEMPIGIIYEDNIGNGANVKVVVSGKAQVLLQNTLAATMGYWAGVSSTTAGRMLQLATPPAVPQDNREIGHSLQTIAAGTNVLSLVQVHFN